MLRSAPASRLECRLAFELAIEARFPRLIPRKPVFGGQPLDLYLLHQAVLRFGGCRRVELENLWERVCELASYLASPTARPAPAPPEAAGAGGGADGAASGSGRKVRGGRHWALHAGAASGQPPGLVSTIRERALRFLLWVEDEAPPGRVAALHALARAHAPLKVAPGAHLEAIAAAGLLGGGLLDLPPYLTDPDPGMAMSAGPVGFQAPNAPLRAPGCAARDKARFAAAGGKRVRSSVGGSGVGSLAAARGGVSGSEDVSDAATPRATAGPLKPDAQRAAAAAAAATEGEEEFAMADGEGEGEAANGEGEGEGEGGEAEGGGGGGASFAAAASTTTTTTTTATTAAATAALRAAASSASPAPAAGLKRRLVDTLQTSQLPPLCARG